MKNPNKTILSQSALNMVLACGVLGAALISTGCQSSYAGQTLPSAYFLDDDIQYFPSGPENKLQREAAALKAARAESGIDN